MNGEELIGKIVEFEHVKMGFKCKGVVKKYFKRKNTTRKYQSKKSHYIVECKGKRTYKYKLHRNDFMVLN